MFYEQLLRAQIPKAAKRQSVFSALLGFASKKAAHRTLIKLTHGLVVKVFKTSI